MEKAQKACCFLTRKCNIKCRACNVINYEVEDLPLEDWEQIFLQIKNLGIEFAVLFGGEPTIRDDLPQMIEFLNHIDLKHTIITNAYRLIVDEKYYKRLMDANPYSISVSVNSVSNIEEQFDDEKKGQMGLRLLKKLQQDGFEGDLTANLAVNRKNIEELPEMVQFFTEHNIWSILTPLHTCSEEEKDFWRYRGVMKEDLSWKGAPVEDWQKLIDTANWFVEWYDSLLLHNSKEYYQNWFPNIIQQDWKCEPDICTLQIDADGSIMACVDIPLDEKYTVFDLDKPEYEKEIKEALERATTPCTGCFWDHLWETNRYANMGEVKKAKQMFEHQHRTQIWKLGKTKLTPEQLEKEAVRRQKNREKNGRL